MNIHDDVIKLFVTVGLSEQKALETVKNDVLTKHLKFVIEEVKWIFFKLCRVQHAFIVEFADHK